MFKRRHGLLRGRSLPGGFVLSLLLGLTACPSPPAPAGAKHDTTTRGGQALNPTPSKSSTTSVPPSGGPPGGAIVQQAASGAPSVDEGKRLYFTACANCHGPDGSGAMMRQMLPKIGDLTSAEMHGRMKDTDIAALITNGRDKMPPFGTIFKPDQIYHIIAYVRTLKKG